MTQYPPLSRDPAEQPTVIVPDMPVSGRSTPRPKPLPDDFRHDVRFYGCPVGGGINASCDPCDWGIWIADGHDLADLIRLVNMHEGIIAVGRTELERQEAIAEAGPQQISYQSIGELETASDLPVTQLPGAIHTHPRQCRPELCNGCFTPRLDTASDLPPGSRCVKCGATEGIWRLSHPVTHVMGTWCREVLPCEQRVTARQATA